jgi:hypothetical protein
MCFTNLIVITPSGLTTPQLTQRESKNKFVCYDMTMQKIVNRVVYPGEPKEYYATIPITAWFFQT